MTAKPCLRTTLLKQYTRSIDMVSVQSLTLLYPLNNVKAPCR